VISISVLAYRLRKRYLWALPFRFNLPFRTAGITPSIHRCSGLRTYSCKWAAMSDNAVSGAASCATVCAVRRADPCVNRRKIADRRLAKPLSALQILRPVSAFLGVFLVSRNRSNTKKIRRMIPVQIDRFAQRLYLSSVVRRIPIRPIAPLNQMKQIRVAVVEGRLMQMANAALRMRRIRTLFAIDFNCFLVTTARGLNSKLAPGPYSVS